MLLELILPEFSLSILFLSTVQFISRWLLPNRTGAIFFNNNLWSKMVFSKNMTIFGEQPSSGAVRGSDVIMIVHIGRSIYVT